MTREEKILFDIIGKETPFTVPDGYFDGLADCIMDKLPHEEHETKIVEMERLPLWRRIPVRKVAASVAVILTIGGGSVFFVKHHSSKQVATVTTVALQGAESHVQDANAHEGYGTFDEVADYVMMDNQDFYASLVAEN